MRLCRYLPAVGPGGGGVRRFSMVTEEGGVKGRKCFCCFFDFFFPFPPPKKKFGPVVLFA